MPATERPGHAGVLVSGGIVLELIDASLEAFLRAAVPLHATDVDVSFEAPSREWSAKLTRPTVNCFLWDIRRSAERSRAGVRTLERDGVTVHQPALPVVELKYVITAWTTDHGDERVLLGGLLNAVLSYPKLPRGFLVDGCEHVGEPTLVLLRSDDAPIDGFRALDGQIKPSLNLLLSSDYDTGLAFAAGPPVLSIDTVVGQLADQASAPAHRRRVAGQVVDPGAVGAIVRSPIDATHVNPAGQFLIRADEGDEIVLETDPPRTTVVPAVGGVSFEAP